MKRFSLIFLIAALWSMALWSRTVLTGDARVDLASNPNRTASNHYAYPIPADTVPALTPAPKGYEPFYIAHYGRHGSRWLTHDHSYNDPVKMLEKAERNGVLTTEGKALLDEVRVIRDASVNRIGELSDIGAEQHQGIARRMFNNFPQVFAGNAHVDTKSTIIIRCILSMINETGALKALNPNLRVTTDASKHDMYYMGWGYGEDTLANHIRTEVKTISKALNRKHIDPSRFAPQFFSNDDFIADSINAQDFMKGIFDLAGSVQNHHALEHIDLFRYFTDAELFELWRLSNIYWYLQWANAPQNGNRMPFIERALLREMIATSDSVVACGGSGASLRFGHETCVLPLACLLEINDINYSCDDLDDLHNKWRNYQIFPMGCNVQLVFYRRNKADRDPLVKVLFNEAEAQLPFKTQQWPYYRWNEIKGYYSHKLNTPIDWAAPAQTAETYSK